MIELRPEDAHAFMARWGDLHDALIQRVEFDVPAASVCLVVQAQDKSAAWASRELRVVLDGLSEYAFGQSPRYLVQTVFEAGVIWDGATVLLSLDAPSSAEASPEGFRRSATYFGGARMLYEVRDPS